MKIEKKCDNGGDLKNLVKEMTSKNSDKISKESKKEKMDKIIKKFSCKKPVYENCRMLAPDGEMLCYCDKRKMNWYLERGLAEQIQANPPIFKLKFEPNSRGCIDEGNKKSDFYTVDRKNCCVVCGFDNNYMRFYIVPVIYRTYLPHFLKSHKSHDVLLLCFPCHEKANKLYDIRKKELAVQYESPLNSLSEEQKINKLILKLKRNADIMIKNFTKLPNDRKCELGGEILECFRNNKGNYLYEGFFLDIFNKTQKINDKTNQININDDCMEKKKFEKNSKQSINSKNDNEENEKDIEESEEESSVDFIKNQNKELSDIIFPETIDELNEDLLNKISKFEISKLQIGDKKSLHGKLVVEKITNFEEFIRSWREYFIKVMEPKFLPEAWNINHQFQRTFGEFSKFSKE